MTHGTILHRRLAERRLDHEWPAELRELWHAARHLSDAILVLEATAERDRARDGAWGMIDGALAAADFAASALLRVEELAAPLLRGREGECDICGDQSIGADETRCYSCRRTLREREG